jgi:hypothetical protein
MGLMEWAEDGRGAGEAETVRQVEGAEESQGPNETESKRLKRMRRSCIRKCV